MARTKSGSGVEPLTNSIRISFYINGERFRETLDLKPTPPNLKHAARLKAEIDGKITHGVFEYATYFPESKNLRKLGLVAGGAQATFKDYAELWYNTTGNLSKGTRIQYRRYLDAVWLPRYGKRVIKEILPSEVESFVADHDWKSVKNMNNHLTALRGPFALAVKDRVISPDRNPAADVENRPYQPPGPDPFTVDELRRVLAYMEKHFHSAITRYFQLAFYAGLRPEEQIVLRWNDFDATHDVLHINKAFSYGEEKGTKTYRARDIELTKPAHQALMNQFIYRGSSSADDFIFLNPRTHKPFPSSQQLRDTYWKKALKELGLRERDMYQTRHTFATMNLMAGAKPMWVARQMGHTSMQMLFRVYSKWIDKADGGSEKAKLERYLEG